MDTGTVALGRIVKAHGIRGEVAVEPWLEWGDALAPGALLCLHWPEGRTGEKRVKALRPHGDRWLICLEGISDRNQAESLIHAEIRMDREALPPLAENEYLWEDLIGLEVVEESGESLGTLVEVIAAGPRRENEVFVVRGNGESEVLLPTTREVILDVDLDGGRMKVSVPKGLQRAGREVIDL